MPLENPYTCLIRQTAINGTQEHHRKRITSSLALSATHLASALATLPGNAKQTTPIAGRKAPARRVVGPRVRKDSVARSTRSVPQQQTHHQTPTTTHQPPTTTLHTISQPSTSLPVQHHNTHQPHPHAMPATPPQPSFRCDPTQPHSRVAGQNRTAKPHPQRGSGPQPSSTCHAPRQHSRHLHDMLQPRSHPTPRVQSPDKPTTGSVYVIFATAFTPPTRNASATSRASSSRGV
jgi:hypothetical protein